MKFEISRELDFIMRVRKPQKVSLRPALKYSQTANDCKTLFDMDRFMAQMDRLVLSGLKFINFIKRKSTF